jgi:DNA-binding IclR family transcriptional regulator
MTAILDTFDSPRRCRSLQDIASLTDLPRSTVHRILEQLAQLGWVQHDSPGYRLGWRADCLPSRVNEESQLREAAAPHLQALAMHAPLAVHLSVLDGSVVRYLDKIGHRVSDVPSRVGGSLPAHVSAAGKAMLAYVDPELIDDVLGRFRPHVDSAALHRELASVRMRGGLSTVRKGPATPVVCIGAPIFDRERRVTGGLSLCDLHSKAPLDRYAPLLLEQARRISLQLHELQQRTKDAPPRPSVRW